MYVAVNIFTLIFGTLIIVTSAASESDELCLQALCQVDAFNKEIKGLLEEKIEELKKEIAKNSKSTSQPSPPSQPSQPSLPSGRGAEKKPRVRNPSTIGDPKKVINGFDNEPDLIDSTNDGMVFVAGTSHSHVYILDKSGNHKKEFTIPGDKHAKGLYSADHTFIATDEGKVFEYTSEGELVGTKDYKEHFIGGIVIDSDGTLYALQESAEGRPTIGIFHQDGSKSRTIKTDINNHTPAIKFDSDGNLCVLRKEDCNIHVLTKSGELVKNIDIYDYFGDDGYCMGLFVDSQNNVYLTDSSIDLYIGGYKVRIRDKNGNEVNSIEHLKNPKDVTVTSDGTVWVVDASEVKLY